MYSSNLDEKTRIKELVVAQAPFGATSATVVNGWHVSPSDPNLHCTVDYTILDGLDISRKHVIDEPLPEPDSNWGAPTERANSKNFDWEAFVRSKPYGIMALSIMSRPLWAYREHPGLLGEENVWISLPVSRCTPKLMAVIAGRKTIRTETLSRARRNSC
ncbi:hypothetical protein PG997_007145 [Apiospora hydei]|uniref:Uncharacterized protein n=1 Tax=Apiospora hydei TaxID=1337664 RepID=A0ABR1WQR7_9PEZI